MRMIKNEEFLRKDKVIGIIKIENMLSGRIFLVKSTDVGERLLQDKVLPRPRDI